MERIFELGQIDTTPTAVKLLKKEDIAIAIKRYGKCDWGDTGPRRSRVNDAEVKKSKGLIVSVYHDSNGTEFYLRTSEDRTMTMVLLPWEFKYLHGYTLKTKNSRKSAASSE